jgi:hypothetical protein
MMNQILAGLAGGSLLPAIILIFYFLERGAAIRKRSRAISLRVFAWLLLGSSLLNIALVFFAEGLEHLDCGNYCDSTVVSYADIYLTSGLLCLIWITASVRAIIDAHRIARSNVRVQPAEVTTNLD